MVVSATFSRLWGRVCDIVFPRWCLGCGTPDESLCPQCHTAWAAPWWRAEADARYLVQFDSEGDDLVVFPVWGKARYAGVVSRGVVGWKHIRDRRADVAFRKLMASNVASLNVSEAFPAVRCGQVTVVPVASGRSRRRDGFRTTSILAQAVADVWAVPMIDGLRAVHRNEMSNTVAGRSHKSRGQRAVVDFRGRDIVLVDDVLTTGATMLGAKRAVESVGGRVVGAIVLAVTTRT